jgi:hypothetical protein
MQLPISTEANYWPFSRNKKDLSEKEKIEMLKLKDIYSLGICIMELMICRTNLKEYSICLESVPLVWAEYADSTALIKTLHECVALDSLSKS